MESLIVSTVFLLGLLGLIYTVNYLYYRFSPVRSFPSVTTLSARALLGMFISGVGYFGTLFCLVSFDSELGLNHSVSLQIYLCIGVFLLLIAAIVGIFDTTKVFGFVVILIIADFSFPRGMKDLRIWVFQ